MDIGIALPAWLMSNDKNGPIILAMLVIVGVVLPLGAAAWFLFSSSKFMGPNQIMQETIDIFIRCSLRLLELPGCNMLHCFPGGQDAIP